MAGLNRKYIVIFIFFLAWLFVLGCYTEPYINLENIDLRDRYPFSGSWSNSDNGGFKRTAHIGAEYIENKLIFEDGGTFTLQLHNQSMQGTFYAKYPYVIFWRDDDNLFIGKYDLHYEKYEILLTRVSGKGMLKNGMDLLEGTWNYSP
jgi:hypothetical protein